MYAKDILYVSHIDHQNEQYRLWRTLFHTETA
jgi:hypothetical protein